MIQLTNRQYNVLEFLMQYIEKWGYPPTMREIGIHFGVGSTNGVNDHLRALERKGYITKEPGLSRSLVIQKYPNGKKYQIKFEDVEPILVRSNVDIKTINEIKELFDDKKPDRSEG